MKTLSDKEFKKVEYLVGFYNRIVDIVSNQGEELDFNTRDTSIYGIGYFENNKGNVTISLIDGSRDMTEFKDSLSTIEDYVKTNSKVDYTKNWEELR